MRLGGWRAAAMALAALIAIAAPAARGQDDPAAAPEAATAGPSKAVGKIRAVPVPAWSNVSFSQWNIEGRTVWLRVMLPKAAARALGDAGKPAPSRADVANLVHDQFTVTTVGADCLPIDQGEGAGEIYALAQTRGMDRFEMIFVCPADGPVTLHDKLLFSRAPGHVNYARVQAGQGRAVAQLFTAQRQAVTIPTGGAATTAGPAPFAGLGALRMASGADRLMILAGLLLLAIGWRDLAMIGASLAMGYLASLALGLNGSLTLEPAAGALALSLMIAALGAAALRSNLSHKYPGGGAAGAAASGLLVLAALGATGAAALHNPATGLAVGGLALLGLVLVWSAGPRPRPRWLLAPAAGLFALIDGMGPAADLMQLKPAPAGLAQALLGEGLGAAGTALAALGLVMGVVWLARRRLALLRGPVMEISGAVLIGAGAFWFVSRLYS